MNKKNFNNKISFAVLSLFILNLLLGNLFLPLKTVAAYTCDSTKNTCYGCNAEGECVKDDSGNHTCPSCNGVCSKQTPSTNNTPVTPGCPCGGGNGEVIPVRIVSDYESEEAREQSKKINTLQDLADVSGYTQKVTEELKNEILNSGFVPDDLKDWVIEGLKKSNLSQEVITSVLEKINNNLPIPENLRELFINKIFEFGNIEELVKSEFIALFLSGLDIDWICHALAEAVIALPFGLGAAISVAISMACPPLLKALVDSLKMSETKGYIEPMITQTVPVPIFDFFQFETGIPGFIKPGQWFKFKSR